jgi:hypothetical protein
MKTISLNIKENMMWDSLDHWRRNKAGLIRIRLESGLRCWSRLPFFVKKAGQV